MNEKEFVNKLKRLVDKLEYMLSDRSDWAAPQELMDVAHTIGRLGEDAPPFAPHMADLARRSETALKRTFDYVAQPPINHALPKHPYERYVAGFGMDARSVDDAEEKLQRLIEAPPDKSFIQNMVVAYEYAGKNTYKLPAPLVGMFLHTNLDNVTTSRLPPAPHATFWVDLSGYPLHIYSPDTLEPMPISGFMWHDTYKETGQRAIRVLAWAPELPSATHFGEDAHLASGLDFGVDDLTTGDVLQTFHDHTYKRHEALYDAGPHDRAWTDTYTLSACMEIGFNLLLYLDADPDLALTVFDEKRRELEDKIARGTKRGRMSSSARRAKKQLQETPSGNVTLVAPAVVKALKAQQDDLEKKASTSSDEDSSSKVRLHMVRGHWRNQPFGPRDSPSYRQVWIKPHLKGDPALGLPDGKTYYVR